MKNIIKYSCSECGYTTTTKTGKCPACGSWGSFEAVQENNFNSNLNPNTTKNFNLVKNISRAIDVKAPERICTGISEFDRVLGGGLVSGSVVLIGGQPGIGKSTLLLQSAGSVAKNLNSPVLYISGEEAQSQVAMRASRIGILSENLFLYCDQNLENALNILNEHDFKFFVLDSVQAMNADNNSGWPGSPNQIRAVAQKIIDISRLKNIPAVMIGHITKDGKIAGPMLLEHMVDTVLNFSGEGYSSYRMLRALKNRYGNTEELGIFEMSENGLKPVIDKSGLYWNKNDSAVPGVAMTIALEGNTPLAVEFQILATRTIFPYPRRTARGIEINRFQLLTAVIDRRCGIPANNHDLYINIAGGLNVQDPSGDLPACVAIASALKNIPLPAGTCWLGEVGLAGEVRPVTRISMRLREAARLGFKSAVISSREKLSGDNKNNFGLENLIRVKSLSEALKFMNN